MSVRWFVVQEDCMICGYSGQSLFPEGPESLECRGCGAMNPVPWEKKEISEEEAENICYAKGITLKDLLKP